MSSIDPNLPQPGIQPYLTIIPNRYPQQKLHAKIGFAKNAFQNPWGYNTNRVGTLWEWVDGVWELLYTVEREGNPPWRA